jgi:hypothetical protein
MIHSDELDDFRNCLKQHGCNRDDFKAELTGKEYSPSGAFGPLYNVHEKITVTCLTTGAHRSYAAGNGSAWIVDFEDDLKAGQFR